MEQKVYEDYPLDSEELHTHMRLEFKVQDNTHLNHLKSAVNKDPESVQALLVDLKNFKEENY